jgi:hypothetical protein
VVIILDLTEEVFVIFRALCKVKAVLPVVLDCIIQLLVSELSLCTPGAEELFSARPRARGEEEAVGSTPITRGTGAVGMSGEAEHGTS